MRKMIYSIFASGNLVVSFSREDVAQAELERLAQASPEVAGRLLLVAFDEGGEVVADCVPGEQLTRA